MRSTKRRRKPEMASTPVSSLTCIGCGAAPSVETQEPFACPARDEGDAEHVLVRRLDPGRTRLFDAGQDEPNPFVRYRRGLHAYSRALCAGFDDAAFVALVRRLDEQVAAVFGRGFVATPLFASPELGAALGLSSPVWVKDETVGVADSHKARHLFGILLHLALAPEDGVEAPLAIASCGNAALAAAVLARAVRRHIDVYVPPDAQPQILERLASLEAHITLCERQEGEVGDPCYLRFRQAVDGGAVPFACQGPDNGLCIEGGHTLGYELASQLGAHMPERIFVQVGGGALASAVGASLREARRAGQIGTLPRLHAVQTRGGYPLVRAYERLAAHIDTQLGTSASSLALDDWGKEALTFREARSLRLRAAWGSDALEGALRFAATHRSQFMWPWESPPHSIAHGILDDETYDWYAVTTAMLESGGYPVVVDENTLGEANHLARAHTQVQVSPTGTAGLAGLAHLARHGQATGTGSLVLFTGRG